MKELVVRSSGLHTTDVDTTIQARIELKGEHRDLWFRGPHGVLQAEGADAFAITCLPMAMSLGVDMVVEDSVSPQLLTSSTTIQDILCKWHSGFRRVAIRAEARRVAARTTGNRSASFFSGGVDSFFTALKHDESVSALIFVHGFDIALEKRELRSRVSRALNEAAAAFGKPLLEIETNSRSITDPHADWLYQQFGPALAGVAMLMSEFDRVLIPSAESYAHLDVVASHPLLDPLWSTEYRTLIHDGCERDRSEKVGAISHFPPAWQWLRVCWENRDGHYNCGRCEKCIRTMLSLEAAGVLDRCTAFEAPLTVDQVNSVEIPNQLVAYHFEEALEALRSAGKRPELTRALERVLLDARSKRVMADLRALPALGLGTMLRRLVARRRPSSGESKEASQPRSRTSGLKA